MKQSIERMTRRVADLQRIYLRHDRFAAKARERWIKADYRLHQMKKAAKTER